MGASGTRKRAAAKKKAEPEKATLRWLKVHRFRNVAPCELRFSPTYNVLLGLNGTGKTTLLELISAALRFNFAKMKKEPFFIEYELGLGDGTIRASVRNEQVRTGHPAGGGDEVASLTRTEPSYKPSAEVVLFNAAEKEELRVRADESGVEVDHGTRESRNLRAEDLYGPRFLVHLAVDNILSGGHAYEKILGAVDIWRNIRRFDEALGSLRVVTGTSTKAIIDKKADEVSWRHEHGSGPIPGSVLKEAERQSRGWGTSSEPSFTMTQEHVDFLSQVARMLGFRRVELRLTHLKTDVNDAVGTSYYYGDFRFMLQRDDGSVIPHTLLSYGQKRALSLLYYLAVNERTVIADELVDGLHHAWIVDAIEAIGDRQAFLASQNPLLLDYLEFRSADEVRRGFIQCRLEKHKKGERMVWSNMSEYDAARFFEAYQVGLQHVSEILRTKGLW
jgi:energy-coupling factor transporter ATP-binding protein EcfA2